MIKNLANNKFILNSYRHISEWRQEYRNKEGFRDLNPKLFQGSNDNYYLKWFNIHFINFIISKCCATFNSRKPIHIFYKQNHAPSTRHLELDFRDREKYAHHGLPPEPLAHPGNSGHCLNIVLPRQCNSE